MGKGMDMGKGKGGPPIQSQSMGLGDRIAQPPLLFSLADSNPPVVNNPAPGPPIDHHPGGGSGGG